jgi:hypothetical protein
MSIDPNKQDQTKKPEQTPADLQMNQNKKNIDSEKKSNEPIHPTKEFVKPTDKNPDSKSQPAN